MVFVVGCADAAIYGSILVSTGTLARRRKVGGVGSISLIALNRGRLRIQEAACAAMRSLALKKLQGTADDQVDHPDSLL